MSERSELNGSRATKGSLSDLTGYDRRQCGQRRESVGEEREKVY